MSFGFRMKKNLAMVLAAFVIAAIITGAVTVVRGISNAAGSNNREKIDFEKSFTAEEAQEIEGLSFENQEGAMNIVLGDGFRVEGKNVPESFVAKIEKGALIVAYKEGNKWFSLDFGWNDFKDAKITITVPQDFAAGEIELFNGSGSMQIASLKAEQITLGNGSGSMEGTGMEGGNLELSSGSGPVILKQMTAKEVEIDSGSGIVSLDEVEIQGLQLSGGSGAFGLSGRIDGNLEIESGSGNVSITLKNAREEYSISADIGSGALWLDGEKFKELQEKNPNAAYTIEVDSGSGRVAIGFSDED